MNGKPHEPKFPLGLNIFDQFHPIEPRRILHRNCFNKDAITLN